MTSVLVKFVLNTIIDDILNLQIFVNFFLFISALHFNFLPIKVSQSRYLYGNFNLIPS